MLSFSEGTNPDGGFGLGGYGTRTNLSLMSTIRRMRHNTSSGLKLLNYLRIQSCLFDGY